MAGIDQEGTVDAYGRNVNNLQRRLAREAARA